jgi:hypothetical protein
MDIIVKYVKPGKWKSWSADNDDVYETGKTKAEAIGNLMLAAESITGITILKELKEDV